MIFSLYAIVIQRAMEYKICHWEVISKVGPCISILFLSIKSLRDTMSSFVSKIKRYGKSSSRSPDGPAQSPIGHSTGVDGAATELSDVKDVKDPNITIIGDDPEKSAAGNLDDDPELKDLPKIVRDTVSLEDDPTALCLTFRYWFLSIFFVVPGAFLSQMSHFRTTTAPYSVFFVQIACHYFGHFLARVLPAKRITIPFTNIGFSLNPGKDFPSQ